MFEQCKVKGFLAVVVAVMIVVMGGTSAFILSELINIPITFMIEEQHLKRKMHLPGQRWSNNI